MMQYGLPLDFIISFCRDMIPEHGEDSYCYSFCDTAGILGVFDGCGGAGARKHEFYSGKTEAYIASRLCAGSFYDSFRATFPCNLSPDQITNEILAPNAIQALVTYEPPKDETGFRMTGSMVRTLPSTAAVALIQQADNDELLVSAIWAGDSRVFILDERGLAQLTIDDTSVPDPMENIYEDGVLKNVFCSDRKVKVHCKTIRVKPPFVVLSATDGCFGYVSTPMEFEGILINTLLNSSSPAEWEVKLAEMIGASAGDDHTICLASFGYNSFTALQKSLSKRYTHILKKYLNPVSNLPVDDRQSRYKLWDQYQADYMRYLKDGLT